MIKLILVFVISVFDLTVSAPVRFQYGIIIDAGSSSSKLHLYRWIPKTEIKQIPKFEDVLYKKFRPGVAAFYPMLDEIEDYVVDMLRILENDVMPEEEISRTRISFLATAGLRFLPEEETLAVLNKVRSVLGNKTLNPFQYDDKDVTVLSGEEESVFSWMTVNYLQGTFDSSKGELESEGMIEIGGGSVQIAYTTEVPVYDGKVSVRVGSQLYDVYTHSFLSYGSGSMATRIQRHLLRENPHATGLINPCMLRDDKRPALMRNKLIKIYGEGNASECGRIVKQYLKPISNENCSPKPCTIGGVYGPPIPSMRFVALGNIHATTTELNVLNKTGELDIQTLESRAAYFCGLNLTEARNEFNVTERWASSDCQNGVYIPMLLRSLGFHDDVKIFAKKYINNVKVGPVQTSQSKDEKESGLVQFMKTVLKDYENIRGKPARSTDFWDVVMITSADDDQRDVFRAQIDAKSKRGELPTGIPYLVISDPPGPKLGNGGSTFTALSYLYKEYKDDMFDLKILLIHAGGQSKRMPSTSVLGKIFSPIPYGNPIFQMLDFKLAMYMPFIPKMGPGVFVACADDMLVYNLGDFEKSNWLFAKNGFTVLGHPSTIQIGTKHGVYVVEDESKIDTLQHIQTLPCVEVLQKPSIERMKARKAILSSGDLKFPDGIKFDGSVAYTDSSFFFAMDVSKKLIEFYENHGPIDCEIDAYGDFLQALGPNASIDYTTNISNVTSPTSSLIPTRQKVYNALHNCAITLLVMNSSKFVHIGTTKEYIHHFCFDQVFQMELGLQKDVFNAWIENEDGGPAKKMKFSTVSSGCVMHSTIPADLFVSENTVLEYCDFDIPVDIGQNSIVSNCCIQKSDLPTKTSKVKIPHNVFLHTVPIKTSNETQYATVAFHINDNLKKEIEAADFQKLPYLGYDIGDALKYCHIDKATSQGQFEHPENIDGKSKCSLWNFCAFPLEPNMTLSLLSAIDLIKAIQKKDNAICDCSEKVLVSMETIIKKKDVMAMLDYREKLHSKIKGN